MSYIAPFFVAFALAVLSASATSPPAPPTDLIPKGLIPTGIIPPATASTAAGAVSGQITQQEGAEETHNDKDIAFKYGSKQGSSSNFKNTASQAGAHGAQAHVQYPYGYFSQYPFYPQYPQYPIGGYPHWGR